MLALLLGSLLADGSLPGTAALDWEGDLSARMVAGIHRFLDAETAGAPARRDRLRTDPTWTAERSRAALRAKLGMVDAAAAPALEFVGGPDSPALAAENASGKIFRVRWAAFGHAGDWHAVQAEGLLFEPAGAVRGDAVVVPDAAELPETEPFAPRLAAQGFRVLSLAPLDRTSVSASAIARPAPAGMTNREWVYRQAFEVGRTLLGYETERALAAARWLRRPGQPQRPLVVVGRGGDGGRVALLAAALEPSFDGCAVLNGFGPREELWREPIDRNLFGILETHGDAEIAALMAARPLRLQRQPGATPGWSAARGGTPGREALPKPEDFHAEAARAVSQGAAATAVPPDGDLIAALATAAGVEPRPAAEPFALPRHDPDFLRERQRRTTGELVDHTQRLLRASADVRAAKWASAKPEKNVDWPARTAALRTEFERDLIGKFDRPLPPPQPRSRRRHETAKWVCHEVVLDVWPEVFAWGWLLLPKDMKPGERRPVVVCQHGLEGLPEDTVATDPAHPGFGPYQGFAARLADEGFVVFAPHNPYRGHDAFRSLQRKANPLGKSLFAVIVAQHRVLTDWLAAQPFVDPARIGFYGLSYGGKTAMRVPALVDRYCLSICSADFNEWAVKNATVDSPYSYMFTGEYEIFEWNLAHGFNYAEMAALIAPRPFMVERGHDDGVAPDEWVGHEFAKVRRLYAKLGIPDRAEIEFFDGPHQIHGVGTFAFLRRHLRWPPPPGDPRRR